MTRAVIDDGDAIRHGQRLALVVRDVDRGRAELLVQPAQLDLHVLAQLLVERRQRLVHQHDARLEHDGARERHALALAARQLVDAPLAVAAELDQLERAPRRGGRSRGWRRRAACSGKAMLAATSMCGNSA